MSDRSVNCVLTDQRPHSGTGTTFALNLSGELTRFLSRPLWQPLKLLRVCERKGEKGRKREGEKSKPPLPRFTSDNHRHFSFQLPSTFRRCSAPPVHSLAKKTPRYEQRLLPSDFFSLSSSFFPINCASRSLAASELARDEDELFCLRASGEAEVFFISLVLLLKPQRGGGAAPGVREAQLHPSTKETLHLQGETR